MKLLIAVNTITSISLATADNYTNFILSSGTVYGKSCDQKIESESCTCEMITDIPNSDISLSPAAPFYSCTEGKCLKRNDGTGPEGCLQIPKGNFTCNDCAASDTSSTSVTGTPSETKTSTPSETKTSTSSAPKTGSVLPLTDSSASIYTYPVISVLAMLIISPLYF